MAFKDLSKGNINALTSSDISGDLLLQSPAGISLYPDFDQTGDDNVVWLRDGAKLVFEGLAPDAYEAKLSAQTLTAAREIYFQDASGTLAYTSDISTALVAFESQITTSYQAYTDQAEIDAVTTANAYTDGRETAITTSYQAYTDQAELDANAYTDGRETAITTAYQAYTDGRETAITTAYQAYTDQAEIDAVTTANAYTDQAELDAVTTANAYTDGRETQITTSYQAYADTAATAAAATVLDSAPAVLDTLNELAAALGDDPNFATTVSDNIGTKVSKAGDTMTGLLTLSGIPTNDLHAATKKYVDDGIANGTAAGADKWTTARDATVTLTGDVTGTATVTVDGTGNWTNSLVTTITDDSHNHIIANIDGLQTALNGKQPYTSVGISPPSTAAEGDFWWDSEEGVLKVRYGSVWVHATPTTASLLYGAGSQTDADMVDGLHASQFIRSDVDDTMEGNLTVNGDIYAIGDVYAFYSDARLKNFNGTIPNALDKVLQLNGYYYTANETAVALGYDASKQEIGVSAQEVEAILPELVATAPVSEEYLTVKYDKMAALFIEAIKELKTENEELKLRLDKLENK